MPTEGRGILSPVRLPVPPLQPLKILRTKNKDGFPSLPSIATQESWAAISMARS
jgi:hypothetical protein